MSRDGHAMTVAAMVAVVAGFELFLAWAFGCGSSDAIPNCARTSDVAVWWALPALSLVLAIFGFIGAAVGIRRRLIAPGVALSAVAAVGWYVGAYAP